MQIDYKKRHIETEKRFYQIMNRQKTFLLTVIIVGLGSFFLYYQYWKIDHSNSINLVIWTLFVGIIFVSQTMIGYSIFEHERKKYIEK
jgi:RsiW-degrading membrane proteinase PrsW (M82 family)